MRVFVAGGTGAIGRALVPKLVAAGHEVTAMARSEEKAERVRDAGARAVICDVFDAEAVHAAMTEAGAEVVVHQLTALPDRLDFRDPGLYTATNRVRTERTRVLLDGAGAAGVRRFVCQSIAFAYEPAGSTLKSEDDPLLENAPGNFAEGIRAITGPPTPRRSASWAGSRRTQAGGLASPSRCASRSARPRPRRPPSLRVRRSRRSPPGFAIGSDVRACRSRSRRRAAGS